MAIRLTVTPSDGRVAPDAYHRVECPQISFDKQSVTFRLRSYLEQTEFPKGFIPEAGKRYLLPAFGDAEYTAPYIIDGGDPHAQAYLFIKTQSEFAGAVDC